MSRQHASFHHDRDDIRIDVLRRLAELAMADATFRSLARDDLGGALAAYGFALNPREMALVTRFRDSLAEAGVDLDLVDAVDVAQIERLLQRLGER
ncbi:MAG TPA: hypothetical protein VFI22_00460 [Thermomicrobiales bacterium]|nr:hypothetical protein [Thermomicrobiales bacterium]